MYHPTSKIVHTIAFGVPVVEHWLECETLSGLSSDQLMLLTSLDNTSHCVCVRVCVCVCMRMCVC